MRRNTNEKCLGQTLCPLSLYYGNMRKHMRKLGSISTSLETTKFTCKAKIWTLGTMELGFAIVSGSQAAMQYINGENYNHTSIVDTSRSLGVDTERQHGTLMIELPMCCSCTFGTKYPSTRSSGAQAILIFIGNLPSASSSSLPEDVCHMMNRSRLGASTTASSSATQNQRSMHRRLWLMRRTHPGMP